MMSLKKCQRCGEETKSFTCSFFNEEMICDVCDKIERLHPMFEEARRVEHQHVVNGNYNYEGIGLPDDFDSFAKEVRAELKENI